MKKLLLVLVMSVSLAFALPPEIKRDQYLKALAKEIKAKNYTQAKVYVEKLEILVKKHSINLPNSYNYFVASVYQHTKNTSLASQYLDIYLTKTGQKGKYYQASLELLTLLEDEEERERIAAAKAKQERERIAAAKAKKERERIAAAKAKRERERIAKEQREKAYIESLKPAMILIKAGSFQMGSNSGNSYEKPVHRVTISQDFYIGKYEVTLGEYRKCVQDSTCRAPLDDKYYQKMCLEDNCPVISVSWDDAKTYTKWLSKKTNQNYRLPTEAEWEYVARAGTTTKYSFGNSDSNLGSYAWYKDNGNERTHKVGTKEPNPWGLYDIHGNVWEWCEDWYTDSYNNTPRDGTDNSSGSHEMKVLRSGSCNYASGSTRSANRAAIDATYHGSNNGFRLARTLH